MHVLSFAFPYFEKFSFQEVSVFSLYNILDIILDRFFLAYPEVSDLHKSGISSI
jgi:hypothetical protein